MVEQALSDVRVVDLTHYIAGPYCTKMLADYGADVVKIEMPGVGDGARKMGPFYKDDPHPEKSGLFLHLNTNKRGITLNLKSDTGKKIFKELVKDADILVENFEPRVMPSLGLGYETLVKINPQLVMTSISNFGQTGPYRDYKASEIILYGMGHDMHQGGLPDREPLAMAGNVNQYQGGLTATIPTMAAFLYARATGIGQHVDISIMETLLNSVDRRIQMLVAYAYTGMVTPRGVSLGGAGWSLGAGVFPCKDGYIDIAGGFPLYWPRFLEFLGKPAKLMEPKFQDYYRRREDPEVIEEGQAVVLSFLLEHTKQELWDKAQEVGLLCGGLNTIDEVFKNEQLQDRGFFVEIEHPVIGRTKYPGAPFRPTETPWQIRRPAPMLGQHNEEVYRQLGYNKEDLAKLRESGVI